MMRIAIVGGGGLGFLLASQLSQAEQAFNIVVLSRSARPEYDEYDIQLNVVDYGSQDSLCYALQGVDLVISTISGSEQLALIDAAGHSRVRLLVPSEFEGPLSRRSRHDPLDRGSREAISLLERWSQASPPMTYTVFSCGVFMERFLQFGLGTQGIGFGSGVSNPGDYIVDINNALADYVDRDAKGHTVKICLTSVHDLVRFVVSAIEIGPGTWPKEFTLRGDRLPLREVVIKCSLYYNVAFNEQVKEYAQLEAWVNYYRAMNDYDRISYYQRLIETANGRYDFQRTNLNDLVSRSSPGSAPPLTFEQWLSHFWQPAS